MWWWICRRQGVGDEVHDLQVSFGRRHCLRKHLPEHVHGQKTGNVSFCSQSCNALNIAVQVCHAIKNLGVCRYACCARAWTRGTATRFFCSLRRKLPIADCATGLC